MKITPIIGLETHVELKTLSKMFCGCDASHFHSEPNTHTCPVCLGLPGALPVPNITAIEWDIKLGLALNCSINQNSFFERKNYFYPDLPKGYQITQLQKPLAINGWLEVSGQKIRINRSHMEEDTGKSQHQTIDLNEVTLIDYNRSGVPLVEIVTEPDIHSSAIAKEYLLKIQQIIRYLGISDADIEKGSMRCEPTINLAIETDDGQTVYTPLAEIKNVASLTGVEMAIEFELKRQLDEWQRTSVTKNSSNKTTRGWDAQKLQTFLQREKEGSADYRYFPEPDIPPLEFTSNQIETIRSTIPELPDAKISRYQNDFGLSQYDAQVLTADQLFSQKFEKATGSKPSKELAKFTANLFLGSQKSDFENSSIDQIDPTHFSKLFQAVSEGKISTTVAKTVSAKAFIVHRDPLVVAKEDGLLQVSDSSKLEEFAKQVIESNPKARDDFLKNPNSIGFLLGQLMKVSGGSANPQMAKEILLKLLS